MTISLSLSAETEAWLRRRAAATGKEVADVVRETLEEKMAIPDSFSDILAPIHQATAASGGLATDEFDDVVEECRNEIFSEKQSRRSK
jgi:hypothetical protein